MTPDELDLQIIDALAENGRAAFKEIARDLGVSDGTVRMRVGRLLESGYLRITAQQNPFGTARGLCAIIGMNLEKRTHRETMEELARLSGVVSVANVTGAYDLVMEVYLPSRDALNVFLFGELAAVPGIRSTETFILLDGINKWVPVRPAPEGLRGT